MTPVRLHELSYGEIHQILVETVLDQMEQSVEQSPLVYFPVVHERVESFLLVNWKDVFEDCRTLTVEEWKQSECFKLFEREVLHECLSNRFEQNMTDRLFSEDKEANV
ncbi:hypothetical protein ACFO4L_16975 [Bacillus daqingensis]|uniref:Uncharacterized protein n=1 Tax=Bacillus daqingensis TaxID=872396 RepID=A0ABV9NY45_9BACI